jgi:hypothetical protein
MLRNSAKRRAGPSKPTCHLFHLFYQAQIRLGSPHMLKNHGREPEDIYDSAIIGHAYLR